MTLILKAVAAFLLLTLLIALIWRGPAPADRTLALAPGDCGVCLGECPVSGARTAITGKVRAGEDS
ncbi:hypothetical protein LG290_15545 [Halomonas sediminis]